MSQAAKISPTMASYVGAVHEEFVPAFGQNLTYVPTGHIDPNGGTVELQPTAYSLKLIHNAAMKQTAHAPAKPAAKTSPAEAALLKFGRNRPGAAAQARVDLKVGQAMHSTPSVSLPSGKLAAQAPSTAPAVKMSVSKPINTLSLPPHMDAAKQNKSGYRDAWDKLSRCAGFIGGPNPMMQAC